MDATIPRREREREREREEIIGKKEIEKERERTMNPLRLKTDLPSTHYHHNIVHIHDL